LQVVQKKAIPAITPTRPIANAGFRCAADTTLPDAFTVVIGVGNNLRQFTIHRPIGMINATVEKSSRSWIVSNTSDIPDMVLRSRTKNWKTWEKSWKDEALATWAAAHDYVREGKLLFLPAV
jgi:hypothetical protein